MLYQWVGTVSSILYIGCLWGVLQQILTIQHRRKKYDTDEERAGFATRSLSVNGFSSSFFSFYSAYIYSIMMPQVDYFIFFTRFFACLITIWVLFELFRDRLLTAHRLPFWVALLLILISAFVFIFRDSLIDSGKKFSISMMLVATAIMFQGGLAQILSIIKQGCTGALSLKMTIVFFFKDLCNVAFGAVIGIDEGWPLMLMGAVSAALKLTNLILFSLYPKDKGERYQTV